MRKIMSIIAIIVACCIPLSACGSTNTKDVPKQKAIEKPKTVDYTGVYYQDYDSDNFLGVCDNGSEIGCKYEITLTKKDISVHYTNSAGTILIWYGTVSTDDVTKNYKDYNHVINVTSKLDPEFTSMDRASDVIFGYEGNHKQFVYFEPKVGPAFVSMDVPNHSPDRVLDTTNVNLYLMTKDTQ